MTNGAADRWNRVSASPTHPESDGLRRDDAQHENAQRDDAYRNDAVPTLTVDDLLRAPGSGTLPLDEKLRQAYYWIVNRAVISPYYDIEYSPTAPLSITVGDAGAQVTLPADASFSSNILLPVLTFAVGGRCLMIGGPGRGKTTVAVLMGVLAGSSPEDVRRHVQQGQPQLTVSDLVGLPLPRDLMEAERLTDVRVAWRDWLTAPVKIVDEYNRIPTKTQSALLTMVAEGYVESYDQMHRTNGDDGVESWYFTANDDAGGGTFPVIQALRDRMDVTVQAAGFNSRFLDELITRVEAGERPEEHVPAELVFTAAERADIRARVRALPVPVPVRRRLEFFLSHFEFVQHGGRRLEYRTKDVVLTAGGDVGETIDANGGADLQADLGAQTLNGPSVRAMQTLVLFAKAIAWFRGAHTVELADIRAVLPFVLRGKLQANATHPRFDVGAERELLTDQMSWLSDLFAESCRQYDGFGRDQDDPVRDLLDEFDAGLEGLDQLQVSQRITAVETQLRRIAAVGKLYGRDFDDLTALKYLHQRYVAYARWQETRR